MIPNLFKYSVAWRLYTVIVLIVVLMSGLCGYIYYYKNRDGIVYQALLTNITVANALPQKVSSLIGEVTLYQRAPTIENEAHISVSLADLRELAATVRERTAVEHEESLFIADGLKQIIANLESTTFETVQLIRDKDLSIKLVDNIDLLNILIDVIQKNVYRFIASELNYSLEIRKKIDSENKYLGILLASFILLTILLVTLLIATIRRSIVQPLLHLEQAFTRYHRDHTYTTPHITTADELGRLAEACNTMVTGMQQRENELAEGEKKYRQFYQQAPVMLHNIDMEGHIIEVNDLWLRTLGYEREEVIGKYSRDFLTPASKEKAMKLFPRLFDLKMIRDISYQMVDKNGNIHDILLTAHMEKDPDGQYTTARAAIIDVTEPNRIKEEKKELEKQLLQSQKIEAIGRLAGGVAHDLNNLLSPILGYSELLAMDTTLSGEQREQLTQISHAGESARDLVRQLLAFSRRQTLEFKSVDLNRTLRNYAKLFARTIRENIEINMVLTEDIKPVWADISQLEQVVMNLVVNASDAMTEGGQLTIETAMTMLDEHYVATHAETCPGEYVVLSISDTGIGMSPEIAQHIFEPFFSTKGEFGTGLGLATVYGIIKQHKGDITTYSEPGIGTTFKVFLPVADTEPGSGGDISTPASIGGTETILVVEDNEQVRGIVGEILVSLGYSVLIAENGNAALSIAETHPEPIQLLLTDVIMPDMNGHKLAAELTMRFPDLQVMYMSGYTDDVIFNQNILASGVTFVQKPFSSAAIDKKIRMLLDGTGTGSKEQIQ